MARHRSESGTVQGRLLREVRTRLRENAALPYDRAWLREWTHYHENYASTLFQRQYGISPHDYFLDCKLELARERIAAGRLSVGAVAEQLHFGSVHHFSRLFKAKTGHAPLAYRRLSSLI